MATVTLSANTSWYLYNFRASTIRSLIGEGYRVICLSPEDDYSARLPELGCEWLPLRMDNQGSKPLRDAGLVLQARPALSWLVLMYQWRGGFRMLGFR